MKFESAAALAAFLAAAGSALTVVGVVVVVGGAVFLIVTYVGTPIPNATYVPNQTLADEYLLAQGEYPTGLWPGAPLGVRVGPVVSEGAAVDVKFYDGGWGGASRQMYLIDPASRPSGLGVSALLQIKLPDRLVSVLVVQSLLPSDRALIAQPVAMTFPEDGANVLTDDILENLLNSTLHAESAHILSSVEINGMVQARGNPGEPNSVELYYKVNAARGRGVVAGLWLDGWKSAYFLYEFPVQSSPGNGLRELGNSGWWYRPSAVHAFQAWYLSYLQGREAQPEWALLPRQAGQARFLQIRGEYGLVTPFLTFWIP